MTFQATVVQKKLEEAGFEPKLAFGITAVLERDVVDDLETKLVTKEYLDARLAELRGDMRADLSDLRSEMSKMQGEMSKFQAEMRNDISRQQADMGRQQAETRALISELRSEMIKWFVAIVGGVGVTVLLAVLRMTR